MKHWKVLIESVEIRYTKPDIFIIIITIINISQG